MQGFWKCGIKGILPRAVSELISFLLVRVQVSHDLLATHPPRESTSSALKHHLAVCLFCLSHPQTGKVQWPQKVGMSLEKSFARISDVLCNTQTPEMTYKRDELRLRERECSVAETEQKKKRDREDLEILL